MNLLAKEVFIPQRDGRPVFPGFVSYISNDQPFLIHRYGWVDESDTYDDFGDSFSYDNGHTWTPPTPRLRSHQVPGGRIRYAENASYFDMGIGKLITLCSRALYPTEGLHVDTRFEVTWDLYDPVNNTWLGERIIPHDLPGGLGISFCFPVKIHDGTLIVPAYSLLTDTGGRVCHYGDWPPALETALVLRGCYQGENEIAWECGEPVLVDGSRSCRGFSENAVAELIDGRLIMVLRGCNGAYPEQPGYKWHCFSEDSGQTWSRPEPLLCADGSEIESGSNGCALFRSTKTGKLYFLGNLAMDGDHANANWPRSPLVIVEMQEQPFSFRRETITVIDRRAPHEPPLTQMSNFRFYEDRQTGDIVIFLSRYGEQDPVVWKLANYYRYRVEVT